MRCVTIIGIGWLVMGLFVVAKAGESGFLPERTVYDDRFHDFIDADARVEILETGFGWAEGPVWVPSMQALLFSDVAEDTIYRWRADAGVDVYLKPSGHPPDDGGFAWRGSNGLAVDGAGRLILAQQGRRVLSRMRAGVTAPQPDYEVLAERFEGAKLNSPNDLLVDQRGGILFTDPPYGLAGFEQSPDKELAYSGVFRWTADTGLQLLDQSLAKPNGIALSPDQTRLYISNSESGQAGIYTYDFDLAKGASNQRLFLDARPFEASGEGSTDGMAMHRLGYLFVSLPGGFGLLSPEGQLLGKIELGQVTNLAFDSDYRFLFITSPDRLMRIALREPGG